MKMKILHLHLMFRYYDQIKFDNKREEYRNFGWLPRTCQISDTCLLKGIVCNKDCYFPDDYTHVCFWRGYTSERMYWKIDEIKIDVGRPEWGASGGSCLVIKFHERTGFEP